MIQVSQLGYLGIQARALEPLAMLLGEVCGLEVRAEAEKLQARMDERHHRIAAYRGKEPALRYIGLELESESALEAAERVLEERGIKVARATQAERLDRAVMDFIHFQGPDRIRIELYRQPTALHEPLRPGRPIGGFVAGTLGLGHIVLVSADPRGAERFYTEVLGFRISDYIHFDGIEIAFLHCNRRHHSIAIVNEVGGLQGGQLNHVMFQTRLLDDVGRAYDIARARKVPLVMQLGKHTNDQMVSFYMACEGFAVEYGCGGRDIEPGWQAVRYDAPHVWGHEGERSGEVR